MFVFVFFLNLAFHVGSIARTQSFAQKESSMRAHRLLVLCCSIFVKSFVVLFCCSFFVVLFVVLIVVVVCLCFFSRLFNFFGGLFSFALFAGTGP